MYFRGFWGIPMDFEGWQMYYAGVHAAGHLSLLKARLRGEALVVQSAFWLGAAGLEADAQPPSNATLEPRRLKPTAKVRRSRATSYSDISSTILTY